MLQLLVAYGLQHWLVVLVNEYDDPLSCLFVGALDYAVEASGRPFFQWVAAVKLFPFGQLFVKHFLKRVRLVVLLRVEVDVQHGVGRPVVGQLVDGKPLEQLPLSLEERLYRADQQALAEAARTTQEVIPALRD